MPARQAKPKPAKPKPAKQKPAKPKPASKPAKKAAKDGAARRQPASQQRREGTAADPLRRYRDRRDPRRSGEPSGQRAARGRPGPPRFVVQQHDATGMHYDFRLESDGVLKSWAVPKGPSADPRDKRLAMPTEDHPLGYAGFEGVIPEGEYGAGPVIVWDSGTYRNQTEGPDGETIGLDEGIRRGHIRFRLNGKKLRGGYSLTRMGGGGRERWLLVKMADEFAAGNGKARRADALGPESVKSGKTIEQVAGQAGGSR